MPSKTTRKCNQCGEIYTGQGKMFCSYSCRMIWRNHNDNPAWRPEVKKKIAHARKGKPTTLGRKLSESQKRKISKALTGRKRPTEIRKWRQTRLFSRRLGMKFTLTHRRNQSKALKGENAPRWRGGITPTNKAIRHTFEYRQWRNAVFQRDDYTCQQCGNHSGNGKAVYLEAHHLKPFSIHSELRFDIDNGITLCRHCHNKTKLPAKAS